MFAAPAPRAVPRLPALTYAGGWSAFSAAAAPNPGSSWCRPGGGEPFSLMVALLVEICRYMPGCIDWERDMASVMAVTRAAGD